MPSSLRRRIQTGGAESLKDQAREQSGHENPFINPKFEILSCPFRPLGPFRRLKRPKGPKGPKGPNNFGFLYAAARWGTLTVRRSRQASVRPRKSWISKPEALAEAGFHCTPRANQSSSSASIHSTTPSRAWALTRKPPATLLIALRCSLLT